MVHAGCFAGARGSFADDGSQSLSHYCQLVHTITLKWVFVRYHLQQCVLTVQVYLCQHVLDGTPALLG